MWFRIEIILYFPLSVLIGFNLISDGYPLKMKFSISGEAQEHQAGFGGTYFLQEDKTNNKPFWVHQSGDSAIWWSPNDYWNIGKFSDLGKKPTAIYGPSNNDSPPYQITNGWWYWNGDEWLDTNDIQFDVITFKQGKLLDLLCKNSFHRLVHAE